MQINKKITPYNYTAGNGRKIEYIVIHYVGAVSTAKNNATYYAGNKLSASAHYFVDENEIWQSVEDKDTAWHCGGGLQGQNGHAFYGKCKNSNSIGVEMCVKKDSNGAWYFEEATVQNTIELVRELMKKYGVPIDRVIRHYDVTGKLCPYPYIDEQTWAEFKRRIEVKDVKHFTDTEGHFAKNDIEELCDFGIVNGTGDGRFEPDKPITRGEAAAMIRRTVRFITGK